METVLFVSHNKQKCGVYQFGLEIAQALKASIKYTFVFVECSSPEELHTFVREINPVAIIYNYYPSTMPWMNSRVVEDFDFPQIGLIHEVNQHVADLADDTIFDYHIAPDPTLVTNNQKVFKTGRLIPEYKNDFSLPQKITIGSFGFPTVGKSFERLLIAVQEEFDEAVIRLHIPNGDFVDRQGEEVAEKCRNLIVKNGIELIVTHDFMTTDDLMDFLAQNTLNAFFYEEGKERGISSVIEKALAVRRPIAVTKSNMFRHILYGNPDLEETAVCVDPDSQIKRIVKDLPRLLLKRRKYMKSGRMESAKFPLYWLLQPSIGLREIIERGMKPFEPFYDEWSRPNIISDYERAVDRALGKLERFEDTIYIDASVLPSSVGIVHDVTKYNRILDDNARRQYENVIRKMTEIAPDVIARKISGANIQQAFVLDTVQKCSSLFSEPRLLCVGSYEDTASISLKSLGYVIDEIDPQVNCSLSSFFNGSSSEKESYDIIFSTSVLEHVANDELFISQIVDLVAPGGFIILTFDFREQWMPGDNKPYEDFRLYNSEDIRKRILPLFKECCLVGEEDWSCPSPDFEYADCKYAFATLVVRKRKR